MQSPQIIHCHKTQRVIIFKIPPLSTSKGYYLEDWKEMLWQGGIKVTEKNKVIRITYLQKNDKVFAETKVPPNYRQAIVKTIDSSRGYAVRLEKPNGGYMWIGTVFRDRNDAFDFGIIFQQYAERSQLQNTIKEQFKGTVDFSLKKDQKIKINFKKSDKQQQSNAQKFFNDYNTNEFKQSKKQSSKNDDWFGDFNNNPKQGQSEKKSQNFWQF